MTHNSIGWRIAALATVVLLPACQDPVPLGPPDEPQMSRVAGQDLRAWFARSSPEVMALPQTVFAAIDQDAGVLVFGVEHEGVARGVQSTMTRLGIPPTAYRTEVTEPVVFMSDNLRSEHRPVVGGVQIHWSQYVCTLGFSVDHAGGRSFITNSHCTNKQGETGNTQYNQPSRTASPDPIGFEADDPEYFRGGLCPRGKVCRYSDASRALYVSGIQSRARIAKTDGVNTGSLNVAGHFSITSQDNSTTGFTVGLTLNKVGRTTGWTGGNVALSCGNVNVSGSNIHMLCQTAVDANVAGGDSGSPVFRVTSGDNVQLVGILWGGSMSGARFWFSPFKSIQDELGSMTATTDGVGGGGSSDPPGNGDDDGPNCPPNSNNPACRQG
jgi:hypothetical protein